MGTNGMGWWRIFKLLLPAALVCLTFGCAPANLPPGHSYIGQNSNGQPNGQGVYTFPNGERYEGEFRDGRPNGRGVYTDARGARFEGEFRGWQFNGLGVYTSSNGERYEGEYRDGVRHGQGTLTRPDGTIRFSGLWSYGRPITSGGSPTQQSRPASDRTRPTIPAAPAAPQGNGRTGVGLVRGGGTYTVPVRINGVIELQFTVDSGASDVTIPADVVLTLIRTGTLTSSDFIGEQTYRLADGRTIQSSVFRIRELKVGDKYAYNVRGSVADVQGSLLLGQSFLGQFSRVSFDNANQRLILE